MEIQTMDVYAAEATAGRADTHVISIRNPGQGPAALREGWGAVTVVRVYDWDDEPPPQEEVWAIVSAAAHAEAAGANLLIHCAMGASRSVGVARALSAVYGVPYDSPFDGNSTIKTAVLAAMGRRITDDTSMFKEA